MKATLRNYKQSPRKVRLVADVLRGKSVPEASRMLSFLDKRAAPQVLKVLKSAAAGAGARGAEGLREEDLYIKEIRIDEGMMLTRYRPAARGAAHPIQRRRSHITIVLGAKSGRQPREENVRTGKGASAKQTEKENDGSSRKQAARGKKSAKS